MRRALAIQWMQLSVVWTIIALVPIGRAYLNSAPSDAWFYIIILLLGLLLIPLLIRWIKFLQSKNMGWTVIILVQLTLSILAGLAFHYSIGEGNLGMKKRTSPQQLMQMNTMKKASFHLFSGNSYTIFTSLMMLSGFALLIEYNEQLNRRKNKETELKISLAQSQIKILQSELQPHFIFNTLHSASSLMEFDTGKAQQLIEQFSVLLRYYIDNMNRMFHSLDEEISFLQEYIKVQQLRHSGDILLALQVPAGCLSLQVPVFLLQPVIENSVKHGWIDRKKPLQILIRAEESKGSLNILVHDNGTQVMATGRSGIGIRNLKERLGVLYAASFSFTEIQNGGYSTEISIPVNS